MPGCGISEGLLPTSQFECRKSNRCWVTLRFVPKWEGEMGASYETTKSFPSNREDLEASLFQTLRELHMEWQKDPADKDHITGKVPLNRNSWGEAIEIRFVNDQTLRIKSKCVLPLQLFDSGKNQNNVLSIIAGIDQRLSEKANSGSGTGRMSLKEAMNVFGLEKEATRAQIDSAYRDHVKRFHPDHLPPGLAEDFKKFAEEKMKVINEAYSLLTKLSSK
jgi:DnaJ-domain-containing protein 1